jgi:hypothetical protein
VGAGGWAGRVEALGKKRGGLFTGQRLEGDLGAAQQLDRVGGEPAERQLGKLGLAFARTQHEHDPPAQQRLRLAERAQEAGVVERRPPQPGGLRAGRLRDLLGLRAQAGLLAADADLDRVGCGVEEALEAGDEGGLFVRASQLEARAAGDEQQAVAALGEFDQAVGEHAPDRNVERGEAGLARRAGQLRWQRFGGEQAPLGGEGETCQGECELVARLSLVADEREEEAERDERERRRERERIGEQGAE